MTPCNCPRKSWSRRCGRPWDGSCWSPATTTYSFRHALAREAVYADLLPGERVRLHGAFAKLLAGRGHTAESAAERAHHSRDRA